MIRTKTLIALALIVLGSLSTKAELLNGVPDNLKEETYRKFDLSQNSSINETMADKLVRHLSLSGQFQTVEAYRINGKIEIEAKSLKLISKVSLKGINFISSDKARDILRLKPNDRFIRKSLLDAGEQLKKFYVESGYLNVKIEIKFETRIDNRIEVIYLVEENLPCLIQSVSFSTINPRLKLRLTQRAKRMTKRPFSTENILKIEKTVNEYLRDKRYLKTQLLQGKVTYNKTKTRARLSYEVTHPYSYEINLKGNEKLWKTKVFNQLKLDEFEVSSIEPNVIIEERTKNAYLMNGFPHAEVKTTERVNNKTFRKIILIDIKEGSKVKIKKFEVTGRISKPSKYYVNFIKDNSSDVLEDGYMVRKDLDLGFENLLTDLKNQGFLRAKILSSRISYSRDKTTADVNLVIDEGPLTQIRRIEFIGAQKIQGAELGKVLSLQAGKALKLNLLEESITKLKNYYYDRGYIEMTLLNEDENLIQYNSDGNEANIVFRISEGPQVRIVGLKVEGNTFTKDFVVRNEIALEPNELLTASRRQQIVKRLNNLGLFSRVTVSTLEEKTDISNRTLLVRVNERLPGLFRSGAGVSYENELFTLQGFVGASYKNLFGTARSLTSRIQLESHIQESKFLQRKITAGYLEPFLFSSRTRGRVILSQTVDETQFDTTNKVSNISESNLLELQLERELTDHLKLIWTFWGLESIKTFQTPTVIDATFASQNDIATIGPTLELDYRDNIYNPRSGTLTRLTTEYSSPDLGSSDTVEFIRSEASFSFYVPLKSVVWANSIRGGYMKNLSTRSDGAIPNSKAFYLHGQTRIRGFGGTQPSELIPDGTDQFTDSDTITSESHYYLYKSEFRIPVRYLDPLSFSVFYDAGAVIVNDADKKAKFTDPLRQSAGIGLHINTPVGPLVVELAQKLGREENERLNRIHIAIGSF